MSRIESPHGPTNRRIGLRQAWTFTPGLLASLVAARRGRSTLRLAWHVPCLFWRVSCLLRQLYALTVDPSRLGGGFEETRKFFYFSELATSIAGFGRFCHDFSFLPFRSQLTLSSFCELAFCERAFVNSSVSDRLPVEYFTALSIAAHSRLSSLERAGLLITMGFFFWEFRLCSG